LAETISPQTKKKNHDLKLSRKKR